MTNFTFLNTPDRRDLHGAAARAERGLFHRYRGIRYTSPYMR